MDERSFEGKVAIVSGGASGIGRAIVGHFSKARAACVVADIDDAWGSLPGMRILIGAGGIRSSGAVGPGWATAVPVSLPLKDHSDL